MLQLGDPKTERIFEAAVYTDRIKDYCRMYIVRSFEERQPVFDQIKDLCNQLTAFSQVNFPDTFQSIQKACHEIIDEIEKLRLMNEPTTEGNCRVCNSKLKTFDTLVKEFGEITVCQNCPTPINQKLDELDELTGAMWI